MSPLNMRPTCDSCHEPIFWRRHLTTGRSAPLNPKPDPTGNIELIGDEEYDVVKVADRAGLLAAGRDLYKSHYATCPQAKTWRTGRKR